MKALGAVIIGSDDYGTLWRADEEALLWESDCPSFHLLNREPIAMVQVTNSTPEPDGSFRDYWLRVPPRIRTAKGAVAWTFGLRGPAYLPKVQT